MSGASKSQVSRLCGEIDDKVNGFLDRVAALALLQLARPDGGQGG